MPFSVYPQKNEAKEIVGYMRVFRNADGRYVYKGHVVEDHEVVSSEDPAVIAFWTYKIKPFEPGPNLHDEIAVLKARLEALEAKV